MSKPDTSVLIVEGNTLPGAEYRSALQGADVNVHVVNNVKAALLIARSKRLSGAIIDRDALDVARPLCAELTKRKVPYLFHGPLSGNTADIMSVFLSAEPPSSHVTHQV
jgi:hypothetical protein